MKTSMCFQPFQLMPLFYCLFYFCYVSYKLSHDENEKCFYCGHCCISWARKALFDDHFNLEMSKTEIKKVLIKTLVLKDILIFLRSPKMQWPFFSFWGGGGGRGLTKKVPANMQTEKACYLQKNHFVSHGV